MFEKAVIYATNAHNGQTRKGTNLPFIIHPMEVAAIVAAMTLRKVKIRVRHGLREKAIRSIS